MELIDITPEESVVPVYLEVLDEEEQAVRDAEYAEITAREEARQAALETKEAAKISAKAKLSKLGLTDEEVEALISG